MKTLILFIALIAILPILAQTDTLDSKSEEDWITTAAKSWVKVSGEAGAYGELYSMKGIASRRPSSTGRVYLRPVLTLFDNINIAFDIFLSTEGSAARQQMDQIGIHPAWGWGQAHIGDFSHEFSRYTLSGVTIRGGGIEINPGLLRLHLIGGQTQRKIDSNPFESAYSRYLVGIKLGVGKKESSFFDINFLRIRDDVSSLSRDKFMTIIVDSIKQDAGYLPKIDTIYSGITPQENLILGTNFVLKVLSGKLQLRGEAVGSVYTKDMYAKELNLDDIPDFVNSIYNSRVSSSADYSYSADILFQERFINAKFGYRVIGPGYTSLGLSSMINDRRVIDGGLGFNLFQGILTVQSSYSTQHDNILKQKIFTTTRNQFSITTGVRPIRSVMISVNYMNNIMESDAPSDTIRLNNVSNAYNFTGNYQFRLLELAHIVMVNYSYQTYSDNNILRRGNDVISQNVMMNFTTAINQDWNASLGFQINSVEIQKQDKSTYGFNARIANRMLAGRLNNSIAYSLNTSSASTSNNIQFQSMYSLTGNHSFNFILRTTHFNGKPPTNYSFTEMTSSLGYTYRF